MPGTEKILREKIKSEKQLLDWIDAVVDRESERYRMVWGEWVENLAAFHGRQDVKVSQDLRLVKVFSPRQLKELEKIVVNLVQPHVRTVASKLQKARPILNCLPATNDETDILAAKVGDRMLQAEWRQQQMDLRRLELATWVAATGNGFWRTYFDPTRGPMADGGVPIGEIVTDTVSPFKVFVEPHRVGIDKARWVVVKELVPIDQAIELYGGAYQKRAGEELRLSSEENSEGKAIFNGRYKSGASMDLGDLLLDMIGLTSQRNEDEDYVELRTLYHLPTARYPGGIYAVCSGKKVLYVGPFADGTKTINVFHFRDVIAPWRLHGDSSATQVRHNQDTYCNLRNIELMYHYDAVCFKWMVPRGSQIDRDALLSRDNEVVEYGAKPNTPEPQRVNGQPVPSTIYNSIELARDEASRSSGVNEASQGIAPAGITAGRALLALQEQDDTRLGTSVQLAESEYARWGTAVLALARRFYKEPRKYALAGEALAGAVEFFEVADLGGTQDVHCQPNSAMPTNKYAKQESVMGLFQAGVLGDPASEETRVRARRMLEFGSKEDMHDDTALDEQVAEKEGTAMVTMAQQVMRATQQQMVMVDPAMQQQMIQQQMMQAVMPIDQWDNHLVHLQVHLRRFKTPGIRDNQAMSIPLREHMNMHLQAMQPQQPPPAPGGDPNAQPPAGHAPDGGQQAIQEEIASQEEPSQPPVATADISQGGGISEPTPRDQQLTQSDYQ
jgi:hypothetical protein